MAGFFQRYIARNFILKLASLLLAVGLWTVVARSPIAEVEVKVPIEFHNLPEALEIDEASFTEAQVRVRGPERFIHNLGQEDVRVQVDLKSVKPGNRTFDLTSEHVHVPQGLEVVQIIPGQFQLSFDERMTRNIVVRPRVIGLAAGTQQRLIADPATIMVSGPKRRVEAIESATTDPVDATGTVTRASFITHAYVSDPLIQVVHPTPIRVTVIMERSEENKTE